MARTRQRTGPGLLGHLIERAAALIGTSFDSLVKIGAPSLDLIPPGQEKLDWLRQKAQRLRKIEEDDLDDFIERQIEKIGYESDAIADGSGLAAKAMEEKYTGIGNLID